jgi:membrane-associated phospholipid phosphatase
MFASATFLYKTFTDIYGKSILSYIVWGTSLTAASFGSYCRYKSGEHYPTNVLAGALFGAAIGYAIPVLHKKSKSESFNFSVVPGSFYLALKF